MPGRSGAGSVRAHDPSGDTAQEIANVAMFVNMTVLAHWRGTVPESVLGLGWTFAVSNGRQSQSGVNGISILAAAVRPDDVGSQVPSPHSLSLVLLGLAALMRQRFAGR